MTTNGLGLINRVQGALTVLVREMLKFGVVGAVAFVIDLGTYNILVFGPHLLGMFSQQSRSEERRVGKECRSRWSPYH